jgi:hypothetical protein
MKHTNIWLPLVVSVLAACSEKSQEHNQPRTIHPPEPELRRLVESTRDSALSTYSKPGFVFKYGIDAQNMMNTFTQTYTCVADTGVSPSVRLALSSSEVDSVLGMMHAIGFFNFPDTFPYVSTGGRIGQIAGSGIAVYFGVRYFDAGVLRKKELWWIDHFYSEDDPDERAVQLRMLIQRLRMMIEEKPEVKNMPRVFRFQRYD